MNAHTMLHTTLLSALIALTLLLGACSSDQVEAPQAAVEATSAGQQATGEQPGTEQAQPENQVQTGPAEQPPAAQAGESDQAMVDRGALQGKMDYQPNDEIMVRRPWVQVRAKPDAKAPALALAYGNDVFTVVAVQGDWLQVRLSPKQLGWIPVSAGRYEPEKQAAKE